MLVLQKKRVNALVLRVFCKRQRTERIHMEMAEMHFSSSPFAQVSKIPWTDAKVVEIDLVNDVHSLRRAFTYILCWTIERVFSFFSLPFEFFKVHFKK